MTVFCLSVMGKNAFLQADKANLRGTVSKTPSPIVLFKDNGAPSHVLSSSQITSSFLLRAKCIKESGRDIGQGLVRKEAAVHVSDLQNLLLSLPLLCKNSPTTQ